MSHRRNLPRPKGANSHTSCRRSISADAHETRVSHIGGIIVHQTPSRCSISQTGAQEHLRPQWHRNKKQIKTSPSPCKRSNLQTAAQETPQSSVASQQTANQNQPFASSRSGNSGIAANSKSKTAIPHADDRFGKQTLTKHIGSITTNSKSTPAILHVDARFRKQQFQTHLGSQPLSKLKEGPRTVLDRAKRQFSKTGWETKYDRGMEN